MDGTARRARNWTVADIPDCSKKIVIVTGANSGMGLEVARELARKGATVILACRRLERGAAAVAAIRSDIPDANVEVMKLDLADLSAVRRFAHEFRVAHDRLDVLVNNAAVLLGPYLETKDGFESHFGINHLGHFALTGLLMEDLLATRASRVVTVSSLGHFMGRIDSCTLGHSSRKRYRAFQAYADSKLANLLFSYELQRRVERTNTLAIAAHPGGAATGLGRNLADRRLYRALLPVLEWLSQSAAEGARSILRAATDSDVQGGEYFGPSGLLGMRGRPVHARSSLRCHDRTVARRLWRISEQLTGVRFPLDDPWSLEAASRALASDSSHA